MGRRFQSMDNLVHDAKDRDQAYENVVNAIFKQGFNDLVHAICKIERQKTAHQNTRSHLKDKGVDYKTVHAMILKGERDCRSAEATVSYLEWWFRTVMPRWRDIDPEAVIKHAHEEARKNDTEAILAKSATVEG